MVLSTEQRREQHARQAIHNAAYRARNREVLAAKQRAYRMTCKERSPEGDRVKQAAYYAEHRERINVKQRAARAARRREVNALHAAHNATYRTSHADKLRADNALRRAQKAAAPIADLTRSDWEAIKALYGQCCVYCKKRPERLTKDHIVPLSRGGNHTVANVVPACLSCNASKNAGPPRSPVQAALLI